MANLDQDQPYDKMLPLKTLSQSDTETCCEPDGPQSTDDFAFCFARFSTGESQRARLTGPLQTRLALLRLFSEPIPRECLRLWLLSPREWGQALHWLDVSGLALYFLARVLEKHLDPMLPRTVLHRLRQNLADNTLRTSWMLAESMAIQREFQRSGFLYAVLKGFSLWPHSVPRLELRSQLDLDYLIAERDAFGARRQIEAHGYRLRAISGRSWEFDTDAPPSSLAELYRPSPNRSLELHLESPNAASAVLAQLDYVRFHGMSVPVLAPPDLFLGQGLHLYKHVCSEFYRPAHLLEFRRHVLARSGDPSFWEQVRERGECSVRARLALGLVTLLVERTMGPFAPEQLTSWTVDRLPFRLRAWVDRYGIRSAVMGQPGSKLYLLLQQEMEALGIGSRRTIQQSLLPRRLPPAIVHAAPHETLSARVRRNFFQCRFILYRLRFHCVAGLGYLREALVWRRIAIARCTEYTLERNPPSGSGVLCVSASGAFHDKGDGYVQNKQVKL